MGDIDFVEEEEYLIVNLVANKEEENPLLSIQTKYSHHHRSVSYGSFLPHFVLDIQNLRRLLENLKTPEHEEIEKGGECTCSSTEVTSPSENSPQEETTRKHQHTDSAITCPPQLSASKNFLSECEQQIELLFEFMSIHLDRIKDEMEQFESKIEILPISEETHSKSEDLTRQDFSDSEEKSITGDSGIEDDHLASPKGFLTRIKDVVQNLKSSLDTALQQLDEMVGIYHHQTKDDAGHSLLMNFKPREQELQNQLEDHLSLIDKKLKELDNNEGNVSKLKETQLLQRAKTQKLTIPHFFSFLLLLLSFCSVVYFAGTHPGSYWIILLRLVRSPLIVILYLYLYGMNILVWARAGINYIGIFKYPSKGVPTPRYIFQIASVFSVLFSILIIACLAVGDIALFYLDKISALVMWAILLIFVLNPLKIFRRAARFAFLLVFVRVLIAPFPVVTFGDFWFADQLNSLVAVFLDVQYLFCYFIREESWTNVVKLKTCTGINNGIRPIISCLPALWRFLQCLRCYQKTRKVSHLVNAVKYFTTFPVVIFATIFALKVKPSVNLYHLNLETTGWVIIMWALSSIIHALYTFYWDVAMDWGLLCLRDGTLLRPKLLYRKWIYPPVILFDFIVRFACAVKLTLAIVYHIDSDVIYTILIVCEMSRRVVWNFFRVEYEHVLQTTKI